jgi:hypothetical protein
MKLNYQNKYGSLTLAPVTDVMHVNEIRGVNIDSQYKFDIKAAEQIALITDNRGVQLAPIKEPEGWRVYVVVHETPETAAVAKIVELVYIGKDSAKQEIRNAQRPAIYTGGS